MQCVKTGCVAYLEQYGEYVVGDAFLINDTIVIRNTWRGPDNPRDYVDFKVTEIDHWFEDNPVGTIFTRVYFWEDVSNVRSR